MKSVSGIRKYSLFTATLLVATAFLSLLSNAYAGGKDGGGGDLVRMFFLKQGEAIVDYLSQDKGGQQFALKHKLDVASIRSYLTTDKVILVSTVAKDSAGSLLDAYGSPDRIELDATAWREYVLKGQNLTQLIFHELLRTQKNVNDDDYMISKKLQITATASNNILLKNLAFGLFSQDFSSAKVLTTEDLSIIKDKEMVCEGQGFSGSLMDRDRVMESIRMDSWVKNIEKIVIKHWRKNIYIISTMEYHGEDIYGKWRDFYKNNYAELRPNYFAGYYQPGTFTINTDFDSYIDKAVQYVRRLENEIVIEQVFLVVPKNTPKDLPTSISNQSGKAFRYIVCKIP